MDQLYGYFKDQARKKMNDVNPIWARLVYEHAFDNNFWGVPWGTKGELAMTDKEIVTLSSLISSGLTNQIALHVHGFIGSGGTLNELRSLIFSTWTRGKNMDNSFIEKMQHEMFDERAKRIELGAPSFTEAEISVFIEELRKGPRDSYNLDLQKPSPFVGFTRFELSQLVSVLAEGRSSWTQLQLLMQSARLRGAGEHEIELILRHSAIYIGESAAIEGAKAWDIVSENFEKESGLALRMFRNSGFYFHQSEFTDWISKEESSQESRIFFDIALVIASERLVEGEFFLQEYLAKKGGADGISDSDYSTLAQIMKLSAQFRSENIIAMFQEHVTQLNRQGTTVKNIEYVRFMRKLSTFVSTSLSPSQKLNSKLVADLTLKDLVSLAGLLANGHNNEIALIAKLRELQTKGLDLPLFQIFENRSIRILGYPVVMNGFLDFRAAKLAQ